MTFQFHRLHDLNSDRYLDGNELFTALYEANSKQLLLNDSEEIPWAEKENILAGNNFYINFSLLIAVFYCKNIFC